VVYSLDALRACSEIDEVVLIVAPSDVARARALLRPGARRTEKVVPGGEARRDSVRAGLAEANPNSDLVLVHDGARPFVTPDVVARTLLAAAAHGAAIAALPATDTLKEVDVECRITATLERSHIWLAQTPQAFRRDLLLRAHQTVPAGSSATDDAGLVEQLGSPVHIVLGDVNNLKITTPEDLARAEQYLSSTTDDNGPRLDLRSGVGFDAHRFTEGRPLVLAGIRFPDAPGLLGHSDADVVCHAISDALLGAAALGDIGQRFPDTDPRYAGASSLALLIQVAALVRAESWGIGNVDAVVIAAHPRIAGRVTEMRQALAEALAIGVEQVSVKGKTTEGMGFTGRGEGIAVHAICTLHRRVGPLHP
jgi:2-C-methyl-D-erythritol 4-phosphate cytidylyltransferase/2-C-methyl-D-erythritol 2,4-cyclodiphosphate synthase